MKDREVDITPVGWTFPEVDKAQELLRVVAAFFGKDGVGITMRADRFVVHVVELDGVAVLPRAKAVRILLGTIQETQRLEAAHESGTYEEARAAAVARAQKAMARVGSKFIIDHPKEDAAEAPETAERKCECGHAQSTHYGPGLLDDTVAGCYGVATDADRWCQCTGFRVKT